MVDYGSLAAEGLSAFTNTFKTVTSRFNVSHHQFLPDEVYVRLSKFIYFGKDFINVPLLIKKNHHKVTNISLF